MTDCPLCGYTLPSEIEMRILVEHHGPVAHVVLNHADRHNAVDWAMLSALKNTARDLKRDRRIRAVILRGAGKSFCSGLDFPKFSKEPARLLQAFFSRHRGIANTFQEANYAWRQLPIPVIAVLHGRCYGAGIQLALSADFRMSTPDCELSIMEAKWGLIPDMAGTIALRELVGMDQAKRLTYTGCIVRGEEAASLGLVTEAHETPLVRAEALAAEICTRSPDSVAASKRLLQACWTADDATTLRRERALQLKVLLGRNVRRAIKANFDKVAPRFSPRSWLL